MDYIYTEHLNLDKFVCFVGCRFVMLRLAVLSEPHTVVLTRRFLCDTCSFYKMTGLFC